MNETFNTPRRRALAKMTAIDDMEHIWRRFHRDQARRERLRMIRRRVITPAHSMKPQLLVRNDLASGGWSPYVGESR